MAVIEADIVTPLRPPRAVTAELIAQHTRFMWTRERLRLIETEIAHAAALGNHHDILRPAIGEGDVRDRIAVARLVALIGRGWPEGGKEEFAPRTAGDEIAIVAKADRPHRIAPVIACSRPIGISEGIAAPYRIIEAHPAIGLLPYAEPPDAAAEIGDVPAFRRPAEVTRTGIDVGGRLGVEDDGRKRLVLVGPGIDEARAAHGTVIVMSELPASR